MPKQDRAGAGYAKTLGVVVVALMVTCMLFYIGMRDNLDPPHERRRITHGEGFSIIAPPGWDHTVAFASSDGRVGNGISLIEGKSEGLPGIFNVIQSPQAQSIADLRGREYQPSELAGFRAWRLAYDQEKLHGVVYRFEANGHWYEVRLERPKSEPIDAEWMAYLNTFHPAPAPTTAPATVPTTTRVGP